MSLEDILRDPNSTWEEIRLVMKSQGLATNGGVVMALVTDTDAAAALTKETEDDNLSSVAQGGIGMTRRKDVCSAHRRQVEDNPTTYGYKPSDRKPASNNPKRRPITEEVASSNTSTIQSVNSSLGSIDIMDFGVADTISYSMETLNEIEIGSKTQSVDENSSFPSNGFLGWNDDDESIINNDENCLNNDSEACKLQQPPRAAPRERKLTREESWHIEDHDFEPEMKHSAVPKMMQRLSSGTISTVSTLLSKLSVELGPGASFLENVKCESQEATTDEVKRALSLTELSTADIAVYLDSIPVYTIVEPYHK